MTKDSLDNRLSKDGFSRKEFLRRAGTLAAGSLFFSFYTGCSDNPVNGGGNGGTPPPPPPVYKTEMDLQLTDGLSGENSPGYVILPSGEKKFSSSGRFELEFEVSDRDESVTLWSGLADTPTDPISYEREFSFVPFQNPFIVRKRDHIPFYLQDFAGNSVLLTRDAAVQEEKLSIASWKNYLSEAHFNARFNMHQATGNLIRWGNTRNEFNPEKIVFAKEIHYVGTTGTKHSFGLEFDDTFSNYKNQFEQVVQPLIRNQVPVEQVDVFLYNSFSDVKDMVLVVPDPTLPERGRIGELFVGFDAPATIESSVIKIVTPVPENNASRKAYDEWLFLHEIAGPLLYNVGGRPTENIRLNQSVLPNRSWFVPGIPDSLPPVDVTVARILNNSSYETGVAQEKLMRFPEKYADLRLANKQMQKPAYSIDSHLGVAPTNITTSR